MEIPATFLTIITKNHNKSSLDTSELLKDFFNNCFKELIKALNITDFQARASKTGDMFEYAFWYLMKNKYKIELSASVSIPKACMVDGGELDFALYKESKIICGIEAKGSDPASSDRPALLRTDTMKKGICQAYQFKRVFAKVPFFIVTNVKPKSGNSACMMALAEGDIVDKFIDVTNFKELSDFAERLRDLVK
ncbi:hypothetical protein HYW20_05600 [Candidatus Woesearchaeota archaeon]|nr:hypothetical protein [Candidatus Woesearchaeota archaeon]